MDLQRSALSASRQLKQCATLLTHATMAEAQPTVLPTAKVMVSCVDCPLSHGLEYMTSANQLEE